MIVRGATEARDELTGNFGSALEDTSISDYRLITLFAEKTVNAIFGVLQHYPAESGSNFSRHTVARRVRYATLCSAMSLSRIARRSVSPLSVPTSSAPMRRL